MIGIIADTIRARLGSMGIKTTRFSTSELWFRADGDLYTIRCYQYHAMIYDGTSSYGHYLYADPEFYARMTKRVRMIVRPTSIWHIVEIGSSIGLPGILDE